MKIARLGQSQVTGLKKGSECFGVLCAGHVFPPHHTIDHISLRSFQTLYALAFVAMRRMFLEKRTKGNKHAGC